MSTDLISHPQQYHGLLPVRLSPINDDNTELIYSGQTSNPSSALMTLNASLVPRPPPSFSLLAVQ